VFALYPERHDTLQVPLGQRSGQWKEPKLDNNALQKTIFAGMHKHYVYIVCTHRVGVARMYVHREIMKRNGNGMGMELEGKKSVRKLHASKWTLSFPRCSRTGAMPSQQAGDTKTKAEIIQDQSTRSRTMI